MEGGRGGGLHARLSGAQALRIRGLVQREGGSLPGLGAARASGFGSGSGRDRLPGGRLAFEGARRAHRLEPPGAGGEPRSAGGERPAPDSSGRPGWQSGLAGSRSGGGPASGGLGGGARPASLGRLHANRSLPAGVCYRAAGWSLAGETSGSRGPMRRIWVRPLVGDWREALSRALARVIGLALEAAEREAPHAVAPSRSSVSSGRTAGIQKICRTFKELLKITPRNFRLAAGSLHWIPFRGIQERYCSAQGNEKQNEAIRSGIRGCGRAQAAGSARERRQQQAGSLLFSRQFPNSPNRRPAL